MAKTLPYLYKEWEISFELMPTGVVDEVTNILRCGTGGDKEQYGDRTPSIFVPGGTSRLLIGSAINGTTNYHG